MTAAAYDSRAMRAADWVMYSARGKCRLRPWQRWFNRAVAPVRGGVERVFATSKRSYGLGRARLWTGARNRVDVSVKLMAYNLRRTLPLDPPRPQAA